VRNSALAALLLTSRLLDSLNILLEIAFKRPILSDAKDGVLLFGKSFGDLGGNDAGAGQHFIFVELQERIQHTGRPSQRQETCLRRVRDAGECVEALGSASKNTDSR
jgi:hypothetical protein